MLLRISWLIVCLLSNVFFLDAASAALVSPSIIVNVPSRTIELYSNGSLYKEFPIAVGKPSTPTPLGNYSIVYMEVNPAWYPPDQPGRVVPSGPGNPLGYRWMGIWNTYGIHGTNAPWSIGSAVSNGCIRMYEPDAEELFDLVKLGTPVKITYDQAKVRLSAKGQVLLGIYPDIYGYGSVTAADVRKLLTPYRVNAFISDDFVRKVLTGAKDQQTVMAGQFSVKVNSRQIKEPGITAQDTLYVPVQAVAEELKQKITWDEANKLVKYKEVSVPGILSSGVVYVASNQLKQLFSYETVWRPAENTFRIDRIVVYLNDQPLDLEVDKAEGILALPALELAERMGRQVKWDQAKKELTATGKRQSTEVPVSVINGAPYIKITNINQFFDAYVYWNEEARTIELTYP